MLNLVVFAVQLCLVSVVFAGMYNIHVYTLCMNWQVYDHPQ